MSEPNTVCASASVAASIAAASSSGGGDSGSGSTHTTTTTTVNNVKWLDYAMNMLNTQRSIYLHSTMSDVTVVAGSVRCKAHQIVLSASSDYFRSVLAATTPMWPASVGSSSSTSPSSASSSQPLAPQPALHFDGPTIIIPDLHPALLEPLMSFIYTGETFVSPAVLSEFLEACNYLKIKGFLNYACMVNGIQLQKQELHQQQQQPQQQPTQPLPVPVSLFATPAYVQPTPPSAPAAQPIPAAVARHATVDIYATPIGYDMVEVDDDGQTMVMGTYEADAAAAAADLDVGTNGSAPSVTHLESFEEYLDDDDEPVEETEVLDAADDDSHEQDADGTDWHTLENVAAQPPQLQSPTSAPDPAAVGQRPQRSRRSAPIERSPAAVKPEAGAGSGDADVATAASVAAAVVSPSAGYASRLAKTYSDASLAAAMVELQAGRTVVEVSAKFDIPRSTIYARMRCSRERVYRQYHQTKLDDAVRCVIETGLSLKEASLQYDVSKTVLWRALKKSNVYKPEDRIQLTRADALLAIQRGETLISISKLYSIPLATLHRDKVRLYSEGKLPDHCKLRKRDVGKNYRNRLNAAVTSCRNGMPQKSASEVYGVPKTTIWRHLQRARRLEANGGVGVGPPKISSGLAPMEQKLDGAGVDADGVEEEGEDVEEEEDDDDGDAMMEECERDDEELEEEDMYEEVTDDAMYKDEAVDDAMYKVDEAAVAGAERSIHALTDDDEDGCYEALIGETPKTSQARRQQTAATSQLTDDRRIEEYDDVNL